MGMFDFVRDAGGALGSKVYDLLNDDEDISKPVTISPERMNELRKANIERTVAELDGGVENFVALVDGEKATITGTVASQEICEKVTLIAGNQAGIGQVDCQLVVAQAGQASVQEGAPQPAAPEATFYTVKSGDTLSKIAKEFYGNANAYMKIFEANKPMLTDPNKIQVGQTLRIPA